MLFLATPLLNSPLIFLELTNGNSQTIFVCNSRQRFLSCPAGNYISIVEAIYGRHNTWVCPATSFAFPYSQFFYWCNVGIKDKIMDMCEDKSSCTIDANPTLLLNGPDPCPFTDKYVKIIYSCSCKLKNLSVFSKNFGSMTIKRSNFHVQYSEQWYLKGWDIPGVLRQ